MFNSIFPILVLSSISFGVLASSVTYKEADMSMESKLCVVASQQGLTAARKVGKRNGIYISRFSKNVTCNGVDIREFAKKSKLHIATQIANKKLILVAGEKSDATDICIQAAEKGLKNLHGSEMSKVNIDGLRCNNLPIREFVKKVQKNAI